MDMMHPEPAMKRAGGSIGADDCLSALSDGLLHAILSFLPAPQAVQTCLLSRRWRRLWRSAPCIEINELDFGISLTISSITLEERWARFEDFATNLLLFHDNTSSLGEFRLCSRVYNWCHVDRWIRRGIKYCPALLQIQICNNDRGFKLPLTMDSSFRRLKVLQLYHMDLDSHFTGLLCSAACPVLKELDLQICNFCGSCSQGITSLTLNKLVLGSCENKTSRPLVITAPSLAYLCLTYGCYQAGISICKMDSLLKAEIYAENDALSHKTQHELLGSLFNVTCLELIGFEAEAVLTEKSGEFPIFHNMRTLDLHSCFVEMYDLNDKLEALGSFVQNAPCLEKLILHYCMFNSYSDSEWEIERKNITLQRQSKKTFQCPKLKLIEVIYDYDHNHQLI